MAKSGKANSNWIKRGIQLPKTVSDPWQELVDAGGHGEVKFLGTGAIGLLVGMPDVIRDAIAIWVIQNARKHPDRITPKAIWGAFLAGFQLWLTTELASQQMNAAPSVRAAWDKFLSQHLQDVDFAANDFAGELRIPQIDAESIATIIASMKSVAADAERHKSVSGDEPEDEKPTRKRGKKGA